MSKSLLEVGSLYQIIERGYWHGLVCICTYSNESLASLFSIMYADTLYNISEDDVHKLVKIESDADVNLDNYFTKGREGDY